MKRGLSVWLDVPLDALARRIAKVGTASRPLLDQPSGDPYAMVATCSCSFKFFHAGETELFLPFYLDKELLTDPLKP
jgi:hypothetical protein